MASSGTYRTNFNAGNIELVWDTTSQNIAGNFSWVRVRVYLNFTYSVSSSTTKNMNININGNSLNMTFTIGSHGAGSRILIGSREIAVNHNNDGTKTVSLSAWAEPNITYSGSWLGRVSVSGSPSLDRIARASTIQSLPGTVNFGSSFTVNINRVDPSVSHTVWIQFGQRGHTLYNVDTSASWTIPTEWANAIPNTTSATARVWVYTNSGGNRIGTVSLPVTLTLPSSARPTFSSLSTSRINGDVPSGWGIYVQGKSRVTVSITGANGYEGSTIRSYSIRMHGGNTVNSSSSTFNLPNHGTISFTGTVTDSRGRTFSRTTSVTVYRYDPPTITSGNVWRSNSAGAEMNNGTYGTFRGSWAVRNVGSNTATAVLQYKLSTASSSGWTTVTAPASGSNRVFGGSLSVNNQYDVRLTITDSVGTKVTWTGTLATAFVTMDFLKGGTGIAFGKVASKPNVVDFGMDTEFNGLAQFPGGVEPIRLRPPMNLNDVVTPGWYYCSLTSEATQILNTPANTAFSLEVVKSAGVAQFFRTYNTGQTYRRDNYSGWNAWERVSGPDYGKINSIDSRTNGLWSFYTPVWNGGGTLSIGNGSIDGWYQHIGYTCHLQVDISRGSSTNIGSGLYTFSLPVEANQWWKITGTGYSSNGSIPLAIQGIGSSVVGLLGPNGRLSSSYPGSWGSGQYIVFQSTYRTASPGA